jgi:hypothetical protein
MRLLCCFWRPRPVQDDYGDGERSKFVFGHDIPDEQLRVADRTRKMVEEKFGPYKSHRDAIANPAKYGPDIIERALRFGSVGIPIQRVKGNAAKAEDSLMWHHYPQPPLHAFVRCGFSLPQS